ncbi:MAG: NUDIX hydrolase [Lachnoclostridium sp.]|nr:NUDIX hydrolase [Lachnoclostridium sp.]
MTTTPLANNHISVDIAILGFDGSDLKVLLLKRTGEDASGLFNDMKLPGSLIYQDEDLDQAANRVLTELTGLSNIQLTQFKAFGSKNRTDNPRDVVWLERAQQARVERIVTIAYFAAVKLDRNLRRIGENGDAEWVNVEHLPQLAFDHNLIISDAITALRREAEHNRSLVFDLLPRRFTASQLRRLYEILDDKQLDVRNFHKKMIQMPYVIALDEYQRGVSHRAARFYRFDRKIYNSTR